MTATTDRADALQRDLAQRIDALVTGDDWQTMLAQSAKFHRYSFGNTMLIVAQRPDATRVAGYRAWQALGRQVRKGEHGISILAPNTYRVDDRERPGEKRTIVKGFRVSTVFDVSQTDGEPLADDIAPVLCDGEAPEGMWDALAKQVASAGFMLARCESAAAIGGANGQTAWGPRTVTVRADVSDAQACKTLAHELAHILLGHEDALFACRGVKEVEAESVAFIVAAALGMSTDGYSLPYVAHWAGGNVETVRQTATKVTKVAAAIIDNMEGK